MVTNSILLSFFGSQSFLEHFSRYDREQEKISKSRLNHFSFQALLTLVDNIMKNVKILRTLKNASSEKTKQIPIKTKKRLCLLSQQKNNV